MGHDDGGEEGDDDGGEEADDDGGAGRDDDGGDGGDDDARDLHGGGLGDEQAVSSSQPYRLSFWAPRTHKNAGAKVYS